MNEKVVPVYVITGFLGSGKSTLLNRILTDAKAKGLKPAIVMNEVGDVNVEGQLIEKDIPMSEVLGGCICCTSRGDLGLELVQLAQEHEPDVIWIESTGIAQPLEIMEGVTEASLYAKLELRNVITVVDARHLLDRLRIGTGKTLKLMKEQIRVASFIILNKTDLVQEQDLLELQEAIKDLNAYARLALTTNAELDPDLLYADIEHNRSFEQEASEHKDDEHCTHENCSHEHEHEHHDHNHEHEHSYHNHSHAHKHGTLHDHVNVVTYYFKGKVDSVVFEAFLKQLPQEIYRAKGIVAFQDTASLFLFQYAYREIDFLRITPQKSVNNVAVFIGEGFSQADLLNQLEQLDITN
ncbi:CobW family GTP-binding protein [Cohnella abietis]|uniref:GTP-binding protein n=1 Tax=Cohnella abietis TaxID=2507935 RepID=A0A3T1D6L5_9BACL|nr:GTP-binding protein [Cohnella abietis]BBI33711.1 GTP-binding protein [Cohnella abietis]